jgi:hypothetical protein
VSEATRERERKQRRREAAKQWPKSVGSRREPSPAECARIEREALLATAENYRAHLANCNGVRHGRSCDICEDARGFLSRMEEGGAK